MMRHRATRIRRARRADAETLSDIAHAAKRYWGYSPRLIATWEADLTVTPAFIAANPVYCAAERQRILGFYALSCEGNAVELEHMWVEPSHIGKGVGAMLFAHAIATTRSLGGAVLEIASDPHAEGFYRRMGARRLGQVASTPRGRMLPLLVVDLSARRGDSAA
jgi:GNAT superfamily N-acetyltransferase